MPLTLSAKHPDRAEHIAEAIAAIQTASALASRQGVLASIPPSLESVTIDPATNAISVVGPMTPATHDALRAINPDAPSFQATIASLNAASQFKPAMANPGDVLEWLLWPGVVLMVVSSLVGLSVSGPAMLRAFRGSKGPAAVKIDGGDVGKRWIIAGASIALICGVIAQVAFFEVKAWAAVVGVLLSERFLVTICAGVIAGESLTGAGDALRLLFMGY